MWRDVVDDVNEVGAGTGRLVLVAVGRTADLEVH